MLFQLRIFAATWNLDANGNWNVNGNWTAPSIFPNAEDAVADMLGVITSNRNITLGQNITIGTINFDNNNRYNISSGANLLFFQVSSGDALCTISNGTGNHRITADIQLNDTLVVSHNTASPFLITGAIGGSEGITRTGTGSGSLRLNNGTNSYLGTTSIEEGTIEYDGDGAIPAGSLVTIGNGIGATALLRIDTDMTAPNAFNVTIDSDGSLQQNGSQRIFISSLSGTGGVQMNGSNNNDNFIDIIGSTNTTFSGTISGGATNASSDPAMGNRLLKSGSSRLTLDSSNTYVSRTFILGGFINVQNGSALGPSGINSATYVEDGGTLEIQSNINLVKELFLNGSGVSGAGAIHCIGGNNTLSQPITLGWGTSTPVTIQIDSGTALESTNVISGTENLTLFGGGTLEYSGTLSNTYAGETFINDGILFLNKTGGAVAITDNIEINGGTLSWLNSNQITDTAVITQISGTLNLNGNTETIATYNLFTGPSLLNGGTLNLNSGGNALTMRFASITSGGTVAITGGGTVVYDDTDGVIASISTTVDLGGGVIVFDIADGPNSIDMRINNTIFNGGLTKIGPGTLELLGMNTYSGGTIITDGTVTGTTSGIQGNITNNSNLIFNQTSVGGNYSGIIDGTGMVDKQGSATVFFIGGNSNTYTGLTTITTGTLDLSRAGATSIPGNVSIEGGNLTWSESEQVANTSMITQTGGIFNLAGNTETIISYTFNGGTNTLAGGTLNLISGGNTLVMRNTTIPAPGTIVLVGAGIVTFDPTNNGTATINCDIDLDGGTRVFDILNGSASTDMLINGVISNGALTKTGNGTLELLGLNTYGGVTTVNGGTLIINTSSIPGDISHIGTVVFDQNFIGTYLDMMTGNGSLIKRGSSILTFINSHTTGTTTVEEGTFIVNGGLSGPGPVNVNVGATLGGIGPINKDISVSGTLAPAASIGTMTVVGNVEFQSGSIFEVELNPLTSDLLDITGSLTINDGSTLSVMPIPGNYTTPSSFLIANTTLGVTGVFSTVTSSLPLFTFDVVYTPTQILLQMSITPVVDLFATGNAGAVAECLNILSPDPNSDLGDVIAALATLPNDTAIEQALLQMQPSAFTSLALAQQNNTIYIRNGITIRLNEILDSCYSECNPFSLWVAPLGAFSRQHSRRLEPGYCSFSPGLIVGMDGAPSACFAWGIGLGYTYTHLDWRRSRGKADLDSVYGILYGQARSQCNYIQGIVMGTYSRYNVDRKIDFGTELIIDRHALSNQKGGEFAANLKTGWLWCCGCFNFSPFISVDYIYLHKGNFKERGADSLDLKVKGYNADLFIAELGFDFSYSLQKTTCGMKPFAKLSYILEERSRGKKLDAFLEGCPLDVKGLYPRRRSLLGVDAGIDLNIPCLVNITLTYQGKYQSNFQDHAFYLEIGRAF